MNWANTKDMLLCGGASLCVLLLGEMRSDFKDLTAAVNNLTLKIQAISSDSISNQVELKDHEARIRAIEREVVDKS